MRVVTRPDLDGLTCAVILTQCETVDAVDLVHPQDVTDSRVTPQAKVAVRVQWGPERRKVAVSAGRSIFNRTSRANLGVLMSLYGGGGHAGAGACLLPAATADTRIAEIAATLERNA